MTTQNLDINIHHLTRIEGHGNIRVNASNGVVEKCEWQVPESPRFFEAMVRGRHYSEVARITSRICGICAVGHTLSSLKATEDALGIPVSEQTLKLRTLLKIAENMDSHIVHLLFLVAPDLMGAKSVFPLIPTHGDTVKQALRLKRFTHEMGSLIGGRTTHPTRAIPGGFSHYPTTKEIREVYNQLIHQVMPDWEKIQATFAKIARGIPDFTRETEYMALTADDHYGLYEGDVQTVMPDGFKERYLLPNYLSFTNEYVVATSTAKHCKNKMDSYMAGALARFNNNHDKLHTEAKAVARLLGLKPLCFNPYMNNVAQAVEIVDCIHTARDILEDLLDNNGIVEEPQLMPTKYGKGFGVTEVPRGVLFHSYEYDADGICVAGDYIIPTNQNHGNIQRDFDKLVPELMAVGLNEVEIEQRLEMLVRAYDPCISCSTHFLQVEWVR